MLLRTHVTSRYASVWTCACVLSARDVGVLLRQRAPPRNTTKFVPRNCRSTTAQWFLERILSPLFVDFLNLKSKAWTLDWTFLACRWLFLLQIWREYLVFFRIYEARKFFKKERQDFLSLDIFADKKISKFWQETLRDEKWMMKNSTCHCMYIRENLPQIPRFHSPDKIPQKLVNSAVNDAVFHS